MPGKSSLFLFMAAVAAFTEGRLFAETSPEGEYAENLAFLRDSADPYRREHLVIEETARVRQEIAWNLRNGKLRPAGLASLKDRDPRTPVGAVNRAAGTVADKIPFLDDAIKPLTVPGEAFLLEGETKQLLERGRAASQARAADHETASKSVRKFRNAFGGGSDAEDASDAYFKRVDMEAKKEQAEFARLEIKLQALKEIRNNLLVEERRLAGEVDSQHGKYLPALGRDYVMVESAVEERGKGSSPER